MEALVALGLASNVVQFVDFSLKIYGKTREVISSAHGATQFNHELEQFCLRLENFSSRLCPIDPSNQHPTSLPSRQDDLARHHGDTIRQHVDGVKNIALDCTLVCHELLDVLKSLRHDSSGRLRLPKALAQVFKEQFKSKKIAQMEDKLKDFQTPLLLHLTALLNERQIYMTRLLESVTSSHEQQFSHTKRFDDLKSQLDSMADDIKALCGKLRDQAIAQTHTPQDEIEDLGHLISGLRLSEEGIGKAAKEQEILRSLDFPEKMLRYERITEAHQRTFEWVFQNRNSKGGDFLHWLQNDNGIFWITGKPGSGKSTLMKFIADHNKTRHALKSWAGEKDVVIASHYFWAIGKEKQKSQRGLLQKMVFDVLSQCPQLAWDIFPERCRQGDRTATAASFSLPHGDTWLLAELRQALLLLSEVTSVPVKFCFLIDGLDEYSEDLIDLCETVKGFAKSENVKCCVSSRPWNEFETMFGGERSALLRVHELTQNDIRRFAHDRLTGIPSEMDLIGLVDTIVKRAEGVFLWVFLVTRELRKGMFNAYTMAELSALLESVPSELEEYFKYMMESVPGQHHSYMAKTLQIALASETAHPLDVYHAYELKDVDVDFACSMPINHDSTFFDQRSSDYKACKQRINDRCKGLLSFSKDQRSFPNKNDSVDFIHRTVHSYLMTRQMQDYLKSKIKVAFHPRLATLESMIFHMRHSLVVSCRYGDIDSLTRARFSGQWSVCLDYIDKAMDEDKETTFRLMDKFANLQYRVEPGTASRLQEQLDSLFMGSYNTMKLTATLDSTASETISYIGGNNHDMVKVCSKGTLLASDYRPYVIARLRNNRDYFRADGLSALGVVLTKSTNDDTWDEENESTVIELLEMGFDPNECLGDGEETHTTPWKLYLRWFNGDIAFKVSAHLFCDTAFSFLKCGADKSVLVDHLDIFVRGVIHDICAGRLRSKLLQDMLASLFETSLQTKTLVLEKFVHWSLAKDSNGASILAIWARSARTTAMSENVEMISIEMMNVSLSGESFMQWLSGWRVLPGSISPRLEAMAEDYLRVSLDKTSFEGWLSGWRVLPGSISPRLEAMAEDYFRVSLDKTSFEGWLSGWRVVPDLPRFEVGFGDYLRAPADEEALVESAREILGNLSEAMDEDTLGVSQKRYRDNVESNDEETSQRPKRRTKAELWF